MELSLEMRVWVAHEESWKDGTVSILLPWKAPRMGEHRVRRQFWREVAWQRTEVANGADF